MSEVRERIAEMVDDTESETLLLTDEFDSAIIGVHREDDRIIAVYSESKIIECLMENSECDFHEAREYFEFNIAGAFMGPATPIYVDDQFLNF